MDSLPHDREWMKARPTVYRGTLMRSTLEARTAQVLDRITGISWEYEPARYADPTGEYLPDFVVRGLPYPLFIDVKGPPLADEARATVVRSMMRVWASIPAAALTIWSAATLDSEPFQLVRREAPIILAALWRCTGCGCRAFARAGVQHRPTCKDCSVAA